MPFLALALFAVLLVALLSRDHDLTASQDAVVTAELNFDEAILSVFPDRIHLSRCRPSALAHPGEVRLAREALWAEGFESVGVYAIDELPGVHVQLGVNRRERMFAVIYDHARAGAWVEIVSRYADGRRWTHTTLQGGGVEPRPENTLVPLPGASIAQLLARARGDRPHTDLRPVNRLDVAPNFEQGYADWIAWHRRRTMRAEMALVSDAEDAENDTHRAA